MVSAFEWGDKFQKIHGDVEGKAEILEKKG